MSTSVNPHKTRRGFQRILYATRFSVQGLSSALRHESAFRQEAALALVLMPAAFWLGNGPLEVLALCGSIALVLIVELLNSALEAVVDRISFDMHELSGRAKDYGSAAVLIALLLCAATWLSLLYKNLVT